MIDSLDERLIKLLEQDAYRNSQVLAKQLSVTSSTVRRRMQKLIQQGTLRIIARPEPSKVGFPLRAIIAFDVAHEKVRPVMKMLASCPEIRWLAATSGRFDLMALVWSTSTDKLFEFIETEISTMEGVKNTETFICMHVEKSY